MKDNKFNKIAVLGGTGKEGKGLAYRWVKSGHKVIIGSRLKEKAEIAAKDLKQLLGEGSDISGLDNRSAAQQADIVVISVPYAAHRATLEELKDVLQKKLLVDVTVPLVPPKITKVQMPVAGSATQEAHEILGDNVQVCAAFQTISYKHLINDGEATCDVLVTGTSLESRAETIKLVEAAGLRGWDAGPIENSVVVEGLASVLININRKYGSTQAGFKITGVQNK